MQEPTTSQLAPLGAGMALRHGLGALLAEGAGPEHVPCASSNSYSLLHLTVSLLHEAWLKGPGCEGPRSGERHSPLVPKRPQR